jgi:hypothetical protein
MSNKDLFKQAIAEAKTIREAAITNAKEALEESLTPHLKEMLAQKLQEMEDAEDTEKIVNEEDMMNDPEGETAHGNVAEAEEEEAEEAEGEEAEEEGEEAEEEELDLENMSVEEFKDLVRDIVAQEIGQEGSEEEIPGEEAPEGEDMTGMDSEEEIDINELLAELAEEDGDVEEGIGSAIKGAIQKGAKAVNTGIEKFVDKANEKEYGKDTAFDRALGKAGDVKAKIAAPVNYKQGFGESAELEEYETGKMKEPSDTATGGLDNIIDTIKAAADKTGKSADAILDAIGNMLHGGKGLGLNKPGGPGPNVTAESEELEEALATVAELRTQLQEVNLLNAKLLYVNKVFKANNLTESQKVNVVAAFDRAETVKEVKLVFETVSKNVVAKPAAIKEHKSFASSAAGTAATAGKKEIISEVSEQVARWQKLAGIIK